ncbi:MAG: phosphoenolpyruvate--protein phosphotransferase [Alphaproteobacteria bacterium]|nr:phosphoenolpyruvate--protein phosphotransferase [Alphaproteobacteria bacterium]
MVEKSVIVRVKEGLHARPATRFVQLAKSFPCDVSLGYNGKSASAKSSVKVMLLNVKENTEVTVITSGEGEEKALQELVGYLSDPLAGLDAPEAAPPSAPEQPAAHKAVGVSEGVAVGSVFPFFPETITIDERRRAASEIDAEMTALVAAFDRVSARMKLGLADQSLAAGNRAIIHALAELANDDAMRADMMEEVRGGAGAVKAILTVAGRNAEAFRGMDDPYQRARAEDIDAIGRQLALAAQDKHDIDLSAVPQGAIIIANDIGAFELAKAPIKNIAGLVCAKGAMTSHIAIIARAHQIPAVLAYGDGVAALRDARLLAIDGKTGEVVKDPGTDTLKSFSERGGAVKAERAALEPFKHVVPRLKDGQVIEVAANIGTLEEIPAALEAGAMGVGLFRTELLYMAHRHLPSEDEQTEIYGKALAAFAPHPVIIRTLDIGGDKPVAGIQFPHEENPFLGWRGIRMCLDRPEIFKPQLRALLRAAPKGKLKVMLPMIADVSELIRTKELISQCAAELAAEGKAHGTFELGIMVETPAAVFNAAELAKLSAFFSIGTNDLTQYVMAADRMNAQVGALNDVTNPAVMNAIAMVAKAGREAGIMVGMCGEAAGRVDLAARFVAMGITELSMNPGQVAKIKRALASLN